MSRNDDFSPQTMFADLAYDNPDDNPAYNDPEMVTDIFNPDMNNDQDDIFEPEEPGDEEPEVEDEADNDFVDEPEDNDGNEPEDNDEKGGIYGSEDIDNVELSRKAKQGHSEDIDNVELSRKAKQGRGDAIIDAIYGAGLGQDSEEARVIIGGNIYTAGTNAKYYLRDKLIKLEAFVESNKSPKPEQLRNLAIDILQTEVGHGDYKDFLWEILNIDQKTMLKRLLHEFQLYNMTSISCKYLFMFLVKKIESMLSKIIPDFENKRQTWESYNRVYNFDSSSPIILFSNQYDAIHDKMDELLPDGYVGAKLPLPGLNGFNYIGFCPIRPLTRIRHLLKYPIKALAEKSGVDISHWIDNWRELLDNPPKLPTVKIPRYKTHATRNSPTIELLRAIINKQKSLLGTLEILEKFFIKLSEYIDKFVPVID